MRKLPDILEVVNEKKERLHASQVLFKFAELTIAQRHRDRLAEDNLVAVSAKLFTLVDQEVAQAFYKERQVFRYENRGRGEFLAVIVVGGGSCSTTPLVAGVVVFCRWLAAVRASCLNGIKIICDRLEVHSD